MAIQEVEISKAKVKNGITRKLNEGAIGQIIDTISISQYVNPEESTVRELTSNAVDSQNEKQIAINILSGVNKKEDYYIERTGAQYDDSNFDKDYYDLNYLDTVNNKVELHYRENITDSPDMGYCDTFEIMDHGVGLGERRLSGYFEIGFSSKRNNNQSLGAFGYGNKVSLSLRNEYYILETAHNGKLYKFQCYAKKIVPLITKFNIEKNTINPSIKFYEGTEEELSVHYEETDVKNYTKIIVPTKKIHRDRIRRAINKQLLYFNVVDFKYHNNNSYSQYTEDVNFKADILHNSKNIIISDNREFGKPHVIITKNEDKDATGVCYGYIKFDELEMQDMHGNIGIKCPIRSVYEDEEGNEIVLQEGVSVNTSRESVIWDTPTKDFIKKQFNEAANEAAVLVEEQLLETDFLKWVSKCSQVISGVDRRSVLGRLVRIIDTDNIKPKYSQDTSIKFASPSTLFYGLKVREVYRNYKREIERQLVTNYNSLATRKVYLKETSSSKKTDSYIYDSNSNFIVVEKVSREILLSQFEESTKYQSKLKLKLPEDQFNAWVDSIIDEKEAYRDKIYKLLQNSEDILDYDAIVVPDSYIDGKTIDADGNVQEVILSAAELRKQNQEVFCYTILPNDWGRNDGKVFDNAKRSVRIKDLNEFEGEIFYAFKEDAYKLHYAAQTMAVQTNSSFYNSNIKLLQISKGNEKYFKNHNHIDRFFATYDENDNKTMNSKLVKWNTARLIGHHIDDFKFLTNYKAIDFDFYNLYLEIRNYYKDNYGFIAKHKYGGVDNDNNSFDDLVIKNCDSMIDLQLFIRENSDDAEAISTKLKEVLEIKEVDPTERYVGIDLEIYDKLQELITYVDPIKTLFNDLQILTYGADIPISEDLEISIREFLTLKNR
jgi:hypothetical protein